MKIKSTYEDLQENIRSLKAPEIEVWKNKYPNREYEIRLSTSECTCICPKTGLPDFLTINITYSPDQYCLELKSFKMYIVSFRNVGIFHEHITNKILDDVVKACKPRWAKLEAIMNPRGGITTIVTAEYKSKQKENK